jgi:hypothetical protein|tara:strand:- start:439 stop:1524 length:1086 start_codon:yes stop_codon:yes gene_type:complete
MKLIKSNIGILLISIILSLTVIEFFFIFKNKDLMNNIKKFNPHDRFMLFEQGDVFKNVESFFKYHSNKNILSKTFYKDDNEWIEEYSYEISTNNFGLVQKNNLIENKKSILLLGDSFVEGQGANSWVNNFDGFYKDYQIINGGIIGTGPQQFELIENHISKNFIIQKVVFFYIGDDIRRNIFNMPEKTLDCLKDYKKCTGNENFYGYPLRENDPTEFLKFLNKYRNYQEDKLPFYDKVKINLKKKITDLYIIKIPINVLRQRFYKSDNEYIKRNFDSINNLFLKYKNDIIFVQLKSKNEVIFGKEFDTFYAENFIKKKTKNHFSCDFNNNINFFHKEDMHPNKDGYNNLYQCVTKILNNNF